MREEGFSSEKRQAGIYFADSLAEIQAILSRAEWNGRKGG